MYRAQGGVRHHARYSPTATGAIHRPLRTYLRFNLNAAMAYNYGEDSIVILPGFCRIGVIACISAILCVQYSRGLPAVFS